MTTDSHRLGAIVGPARSGTTWAGALIDSCPDVIYRFEPFHRMASVDPAFRGWIERLKQQQVGEADLTALYALLCRAHPQTNKPPFFPDKSYDLTTIGRQQVWPFARKLSIARKLYETVYSPAPGPPLVFKEVTFVAATRNFLTRTSLPIVYLVRHPCATVLSEVRGQQRGQMPSTRQRNLGKILRESAPELAERYEDVIDGNDAVRREALLWRFEVESCVPHVRQSARGMVLTYEQLADDTHRQVRGLLGHFGLPFAEQTERFVDLLLGIGAKTHAAPRKTGWGSKYFSIYRNPRQEKDAWMSKISTEDREKIEKIVGDSEAVAYCARLGRWQ